LFDEHSTTIEFIDGDSESEGSLVIRRVGKHIGLCISLKQDGDIEAFLEKDDVLRLVAALQKITG